MVGFRCWTCGGVFDRMWGDTCNHCRETERRHQELLSALKNRSGAKVERREQAFDDPRMQRMDIVNGDPKSRWP